MEAHKSLFAFVESVGALLVVAHHRELRDRWMVKFVVRRDVRYIPPALRRSGPVFALSSTILPWLRTIMGLLQLPVLQQSTGSISYRLSIRKRLISDGLLTEFLVATRQLPVWHFYSMQGIEADAVSLVGSTAIIGSNWVEFGCMDEAAYRRHLAFLNERYPDAIYYCHPKEASGNAVAIFGEARVARPDTPVELHLRAVGIPGTLVGVCSSSLLSLALTWPEHVGVDLIELDESCLNGRAGAVLERFRKPVGGLTEVSISDLQDYLHDVLVANAVAVRRVKQQ